MLLRAVLVIVGLLLACQCAQPRLTPSWRWHLPSRIVHALKSILGPGHSSNFELTGHMHTLQPRGSGLVAIQDRPMPEECIRCSSGIHPQPGMAGRVNSIWSGLDSANTSSPAIPGQFPWQVALLHKKQYLCSGALVSDQWVLTAARCLHGRPVVIVRVGSFMPNAQTERFRVSLPVTHMVTHPRYRPSSPLHNIAALRLPTAVTFNGYTLPVRLPTLNSFTTTYFDREARLSGWGINATGPLKNDSVLGYVFEKILSNEECSKTYGQQINPSYLCTTSRSLTRGCVGDSGAPLVVPSEERSVFTLVGLFSFSSSSGCSAGHPAGFTRITSYLRWIQNTTGIALHHIDNDLK